MVNNHFYVGEWYHDSCYCVFNRKVYNQAIIYHCDEHLYSRYVFCRNCVDFNTLIMGRIVQSVGAGIMMPLMQSVFLLMFPVKSRGMAMGLVGLVISFAPAIGPTVSGWIITTYSWRAVFYI